MFRLFIVIDRVCSCLIKFKREKKTGKTGVQLTMPYLIFVIGAIIGLYALYRFFINANVQQIKAAFLTAALIIFAIALFFLALTGKLPAAIGLGVAVIPFIIAHFRRKYLSEQHKDNTTRDQDSDQAPPREIVIDLNDGEDTENDENSENEDKKDD